MPTGWSAPSTVGSAAGFSTASQGTLSVSGQTIIVSALTRTVGQTFTITYGDTGSGGSGATLPATTGAVTFTTTQKSTSTGVLTGIASDPTGIVITSTAPVLITPATNAYQASGGTPIFVKTASGSFRIGIFDSGSVTSVVFPAGPGSGVTGPTTTVNGASQTMGTTLMVADASSSAAVGSFTATGLTGTCAYTGNTGTQFTGITGCTGTATDAGAVVMVTATITTATSGNYQSPSYIWATPVGTPSIATIMINGTISESVSVNFDSTAPAFSVDGSTGLAPNPRTNGASFTLTATDGGSGVKALYYTLDGSTTPTFDGSGNAILPTVKIAGATGSVTVANVEGTYTPKFLAVDNIGNASSTTTGTAVVVDKTNPTDSVAVQSSSPLLNGQPAALITGATVFYRGTSGSTGNLVLRDTVTDALSGAKQATFGSLGGTTTGFTFTGATDGSAPFDTNTIQWADGTTSAPILLVTGQDNATNNATGTPLTFANDIAGPAASATTVSPTTRTTSASITLSATDAGAGVFAIYYTTNGDAPAYDASGVATGTTTRLLGASPSAVVISADGTYTLRYTSVDSLGNAGSTTTGQTFTIDSTNPVSAFTAPAAAAVISGASVTVSGTGTDTGGSGVASIQIGIQPTGAGSFSNVGSATAAAATTISRTLDTTGLANGAATLRIVTTDNAGNTHTATRSVTIDNANPTVGASASPTGTTTAASAAATFTATDTSTLTSPTYELRTGTFSGGTCGSFGAFGAIVPTGTSASSTFTQTLADGSCYEFRYTVSDSASPVHTASATVVVSRDATAPSVTAITAPTASAVVSEAVALTATAADAASGVASVEFKHRLAGGGAYTSISTDTTSPYTGSWQTGPTASIANGSYEIVSVATDGAGNTLQSAAVAVTVTNPARTLSSSAVNSAGTSLAMTYSGATDATSVPPAGAFTVVVNGSAATVSGVSVSGSVVTLTLSAAVKSGETVTVAYPTLSTPRLRSSVGVDTAIFTAQTVTNSSTVAAAAPPSSDTTAPTATGATANGAVVVITFSESLVGTPPLSAFTLNGASGGPRTPIAVTVSGGTVTLAFGSGVVAGETLTASFGGGGLSDAASNAVAPFTIGVANNTVPFAGSGDGSVTGGTGGAFVLTGAYVNSGTMILTFSRTLAAGTTPVSAFRVTGSSSGSQVPTSVTKSGSSITLTLATAALSGETVLISYSRPASGFVSATDGAAAVAFVGALATNTTVGVPAPPPPASAAPTIVSTSPNDGLTVPSIGQITIVASKLVAWSDLAVELPDRTITPLSPDAQGSSTTVQRTFAASAATGAGSYSITGKMSDGVNPPVAFESHFTIYTQPILTSDPTGTASTNLAGSKAQDAPPVERLAEPDKAGALVASNGVVSLSWPASTFANRTIVKVDPVPVTSDTTGGSTPRVTTSGVGAVFAAGGSAVEITATRLSNGESITSFDAPLEIEFPNAPAGIVPSSSKDGRTWTPLPLLAGTTLPAGQPDGYFRDSFNTIHIFTRHLTYFGVLVRPAAAPVAAMLVVAPKLYLGDRRTFGFMLRVTEKATVSAVLRTGKTQLLTWPRRSVAAGAYVLKSRLAKQQSLNGSTAVLEVRIQAGKRSFRMFRTIEFRTAPVVAPARPVVLLVNGADLRRTLQAKLTTAYRIAYYATHAESLELIADPKRPIDAVVVDLSKEPSSQQQRLGLIRNLHYLFPDLRIVVASNSLELQVAVIKVGADAAILAPVGAKALAAELKILFHRA